MTRQAAYNRIFKRVKGEDAEYTYDVIEPMLNEEFKQIENSFIYISNQGRLARKTKDGLVQMKMDTNKVYPSRRLNGRTMPLHRIVYELFVGPIPKGMFVDHINEDKGDFRLSNLRLTTPAENVRFSLGFVYLVTNKLTRDTWTVSHSKDASDIIELGMTSVSDLVTGVRTHPVWTVEKICRLLDYDRGMLSMDSILHFRGVFDYLQ